MTITLETLIEQARKQLGEDEHRRSYSHRTSWKADLIEGVTGRPYDEILDLIFAKPEPKLPPMPEGFGGTKIPSRITDGRLLSVDERAGEDVWLSVDRPDHAVGLQIVVSRRALLEALGWTGESK